MQRLEKVRDRLSRAIEKSDAKDSMNVVSAYVIEECRHLLEDSTLRPDVVRVLAQWLELGDDWLDRIARYSIPALNLTELRGEFAAFIDRFLEESPEHAHGAESFVLKRLKDDLAALSRSGE